MASTIGARRILALAATLGLLIALSVALGTSLAHAAPAWGTTTESCLLCHKGPPSSAVEIYAAAHDSAVGECLTCHTIENESIHGAWTDTPSACARCHRTHSAVEERLLVMDKTDLCLFCHGTSAGLAQTNVLDGILRTDTGPLRGGGFEQARMITNRVSLAGEPTAWSDWQFPIGSTPLQASTSEHTLGTEATIWGSWNAEGVSAVPNAGDTNTTLECVSCHDPHAYGQTYRMLTRRPADSGVAKHPDELSDPWEQRVLVTDQLEYAEHYPISDILSYTTDDYSNTQIGAKAWDAGSRTWVVRKTPGTSYAAPDVLDPDTGGPINVDNIFGTTRMYSQQLTEWCASCHDRYHAAQLDHMAPGSTNSGDAIFSYRHKTGDETPEWNGVELASGTHDGGNATAVLTDSGADFAADGVVIGDIVLNLTDGSDGTVSVVAATTIGGSLDGGADNLWDEGDEYILYDSEDSGWATTSCGYGCHNSRQLNCLGCHVAHGTTAAMTSIISAMPWPGTDGGHYDTQTGGTKLGEGQLAQDPRPEFTGGTDHDSEFRSNLLRLDNRGVCQNPACHAKGKTDYTEPYEEFVEIIPAYDSWDELTAAGTDVQVGSGGVTVEFSNVSTGGNTIATPLAGNPGGPTPADFDVVGSFWEISTTATYSGTITVCFTYDPSSVHSGLELAIFHWDGAQWVNVTTSVDTVNHTICGEVSSLSPFFAGGTSTLTGDRQSCDRCHTSTGASPHDSVGPTDCALCHGSSFSGSCDSCHGAPPTTGAHTTHFGGDASQASYGGTDNVSSAAAYIFECGTCHSMDSADHRNGTVNIELYNASAPPGSLKSMNPVTASYTPGGTTLTDVDGIDYTLGTCGDVYCHSKTDWSSPDPISQPLVAPDGYLMLNEYGNLVYDPYTVTEFKVYSSVGWGDAPLDCNSCHRNNPQTFWPEVQAAVGNSHANVDDWGWENLHSYVHGFDALNCRSCHFSTVTDPMTWTRGAGDITYYDDVPIANKASHANGTKDVAFDTVNPVTLRSTFDLSSMTYDPATKVCYSAPCHLNQENPQWGIPYRYGWGSAECDQCHRYGSPFPPSYPWPPAAGPSMALSGAMAPIAGDASTHPGGSPAGECSTCHVAHR